MHKVHNMSNSKKHLLLESIFNNIKKNIYLYALIILCIIFVLAKLVFLNHNPVWDESVYLGMGKYIYSQGNTGLWEMIRPLGLPVISGMFWKLGLNQVIASRLFSVLISVGCIIFTFLIAKELFNKKHAILSALILACTPIFFYYSDYVLTDHISTLFLIASVFFIIKEKFILAGILGGLTFWFKFTHILYIGAIILFIVYKIIILKNRKNISKYIYTLVIISVFIASYFLSNYLLYHNHLGPINSILKPYTDAAKYSNNPYQNNYFTNFSEFIYYPCYYIYNIMLNNLYGSMIYLFFLIYLMSCFEFFKKENHAFIMILFITYLAYFSFIPYKNERFEIFFLPIMTIYAAYGVIKIIENIHSKYIKYNKYHKYPKFYKKNKTLIKTKSEFKKSKKINKKQNHKTYQRYILFGILLLLFSILIISLFSVSIHKISQFYKWKQGDEKLNYNIEKYMDIYMNSNNISGIILTTDPRFVVYSEKHYIGAYDVLNTKGLFVNDWESNNNFSAIIYNDKVIPCYDSDSNCMSHKRALLDMINQDFVKKDSYIYHNSEVIFYIRK